MKKQLDLKALLESKTANIEPVEEAKTTIEKGKLSVPKNLTDTPQRGYSVMSK